jgi:hypothetical protein
MVAGFGKSHEATYLIVFWIPILDFGFLDSGFLVCEKLQTGVQIPILFTVGCVISEPQDPYL